MEGSGKSQGRAWSPGPGDILIDIYLDLVSSSDVILPPLSSKVVKYLIDSGSILKDLGSLSSSKDHYKPFFISCLYGADGERLYKARVKRDRDIPITVRGGTHLEGRVSAVVPRSVISDIVGMSGGFYRTPYGSFSVSLKRIEVFDLKELRRDLSKGFTMIFKTPVLLSPKMLLPPIKKIIDKYGKARVGYLMLPVPGLIFAYALRLWNSSVPEDLRLTRPNDKDDIYSYRIAVMGTALTEVVGHAIKIRSVIIGDDKSGRLRKARGFIGYIVMNINHKITRRAMERALALAEHLGIGRGRGIGLGEIEIGPRIREPEPGGEEN